MRPAKACSQCRIGKRRCDRARNDGPCDQCLRRNLVCSAGDHDPTAHPASSDVLRSSVTLPTTDLESEISYLVDLYFEFMHDKPHTLFHEFSFKSSVAEGTASRTVLWSMMGLSARFAEDPEVRSRGPLYAAEAKDMFKADFEHVCIENIQACILIGNICLGESDPDAESLYFVLANRMAQILKLGIIIDSDDPITRETKLRLWWSCFIIDTWASGGSNLARQFKLQAGNPRVPMDEATFLSMRPGDPDVAISEWKPGLWGYMVKLVEIYAQIQDLNKYLVETTEWDEDSIEVAVRGLAAQLMNFEESLRPEIKYSAENLELHTRRGLGRTFIAFHLGYHHYWTILCYQYLDQHRPSTTNGKTYADYCKQHASVFCDILKASREQPGAEALYNIVGHLTVVSSSVLLHTYLFGDADELPDVRRRLESNFESLVHLRNYWPSVELMINRLVVFQNRCMRSLSSNTHRFDKWMVRFLLEHAVALDEKADDYPHSWSGSTTQIMEFRHYERSLVTQSIIKNMQGLS